MKWPGLDELIPRTSFGAGGQSSGGRTGDSAIAGKIQRGLDQQLSSAHDVESDRCSSFRRSFSLQLLFQRNSRDIVLWIIIDLCFCFCVPSPYNDDRCTAWHTYNLSDSLPLSPDDWRKSIMQIAVISDIHGNECLWKKVKTKATHNRYFAEFVNEPRRSWLAGPRKSAA